MQTLVLSVFGWMGSHPAILFWLFASAMVVGAVGRGMVAVGLALEKMGARRHCRDGGR